MIEKTFNCVSEEVLNDYLTGLSLPDIKEKYGYVIIYLWEWDINECLKNKTINEFLLSNLIYGG